MRKTFLMRPRSSPESPASATASAPESSLGSRLAPAFAPGEQLPQQNSRSLRFCTEYPRLRSALAIAFAWRSSMFQYGPLSTDDVHSPNSSSTSRGTHPSMRGQSQHG